MAEYEPNYLGLLVPKDMPTQRYSAFQALNQQLERMRGIFADGATLPMEAFGIAPGEYEPPPVCGEPPLDPKVFKDWLALTYPDERFLMDCEEAYVHGDGSVYIEGSFLLREVQLLYWWAQTVQRDSDYFEEELDE